ncbi:hypothetical protein CF319_g9039 [Tilletia indica]|nr:hypothetical protein CF319_g9039 [Tilletia indica]
MEGGTSGGVPMGPSYAVRSGSLPFSASGRVNQGISTTMGGAATVRKDSRRTSYLLSPTESAASSNVSSSDATSVSGGGGGDSGGQMMTVLSPVLAAVPDIVSSPQGGVTSKWMNPAAFGGVSNGTSRPSWDEDRANNRSGSLDRESGRSMTMKDSRLATGRQGYASGYDPAMLAEHALAQAKAQRTFLANLPRVGALLTLDLKSNDIGLASIAPASVDKRKRVNAWETVKKRIVNVYLEDQDGKILRPKDVKVCRHGDKAMCDHYMPLEGGGHWWPWQERNLRAAEELQRVDMEEPTTMKTLIADIAAAMRASMAGVSGPVVGQHAPPRRAEPVAAPAPAAPASPPVRSTPPSASRNAEPDPF